MKDGDRDDGCDVEPQANVQMPLATGQQRHHEVHDEEKCPDDRDCQIDRPLHLCVLFALRNPHRERHRRRHDDRLPAPKMEPPQRPTPHAAFAKPLSAVIDCGKNRVAGKSKNGRIGMQGTQPSERKHRPNVAPEHVRNRWHDQKHRDQNTNGGTDEPPKNGCGHEKSNNRIVVAKLFQCFRFGGSQRSLRHDEKLAIKNVAGNIASQPRLPEWLEASTQRCYRL